MHVFLPVINAYCIHSALIINHNLLRLAVSITSLCLGYNIHCLQCLRVWQVPLTQVVLE